MKITLNTKTREIVEEFEVENERFLLAETVPILVAAMIGTITKHPRMENWDRICDLVSDSIKSGVQYVKETKID